MTQLKFFFGGWMPLVRIVVVGVAMYVALVMFLRISGSRTLSDMNAFDFIVTVAIGSVFGRALTAKSVALAEAVVAFVLLVVLQYVVTRLQVQSTLFERLVTNPPSLLYFQGEFLRGEMARQRVTESELRAAARKHKEGSVDAIDAIVLESNGEFSIIKSADAEQYREEFDDELSGEGG